MAKLNEKKTVTTLNANDTVPLTLEDGSIARIKKSNLAEALLGVMAVATNENNGLLSSGNLNKLNLAAFCEGQSGGQPTKWLKLGCFATGAYDGVRLLCDIGTYNSTSRLKYDLTFTMSGSSFIVTGSLNSAGWIGYTIQTGASFTLYIRLLATRSVMGSVHGGKLIEGTSNEAVEPEGIIYV